MKDGAIGINSALASSLQDSKAIPKIFQNLVFCFDFILGFSRPKKPPISNRALFSGDGFAWIKPESKSLPNSQILKHFGYIFAPVEGSLKLPRILRGQDCKEVIFSCNNEEAEIYNNLGYLFENCYRSSSEVNRHGNTDKLITTGCYFSEALFKAILSVDWQSTEDAYVNIAKTILTHLDTEGTPFIKKYIGFLELTPADANSPIFDEAKMYMGEDEVTDMQKFIDDLQAAIFTDANLVKNLN